MVTESISNFPNLNVPDLGRFVRRKHDLEIEELSLNIHTVFNPSIDFHPQYHQLYFRVAWGRAAFFQRCLVYMTTDLSIPAVNLIARPADWILGGEYTPRPSDWQKYPTQSGDRYYWFFGQHRNPSGGSWTADVLFGHTYDIYENGTLSTIHYDDTGGDQDADDFVLEAAIVGRQSWQELVQARDQEDINERYTREGLPKLKSRMYKHDSKD